MELVLKQSTIRDWNLDDAASLAEQANNRQIWLQVRDIMPYPYTIADANVFLEKATNANPRTNFCIEIDGNVAGGVVIKPGEDVHRRTAEVGYWLGQKFWGRGVATEAITAFVEHCFSSFNLVRIFGQVNANNPASARVLEKAGFVLEGRMRKHVIKDGVILDSLLYAKTK
jgi:RimJ/RimL family protein N-acetyltransferase